MSQLKHAPPLPELRPLDPGFSIIRFQFPPTGFSEERTVNWASATGMTRENPILQFSNGNQRTYTFGARLWAANSDEDIEPIVIELERATERDPNLGRPPRWCFVWGTAVNETVVVQSIGGIRYDDLRHDGSLRGVTLQMTLLVWRFIDVEITGQPLPSTFYAVIKEGDTWESLALREYKDPILGDLLRRQNPEIMFPTDHVGKVVALPPLNTLLESGVLEPDSAPLQRTAESLEVRADLFEKRASRKSSIILKHG